MAVALCTDFQYAPHSMIITQRIAMPQFSQAHTKTFKLKCKVCPSHKFSIVFNYAHTNNNSCDDVSEVVNIVFIYRFKPRTYFVHICLLISVDPVHNLSQNTCMLFLWCMVV